MYLKVIEKFYDRYNEEVTTKTALFEPIENIEKITAKGTYNEEGAIAVELKNNHTKLFANDYDTHYEITFVKVCGV